MSEFLAGTLLGAGELKGFQLLIRTDHQVTRLDIEEGASLGFLLAHSSARGAQGSGIDRTTTASQVPVSCDKDGIAIGEVRVAEDQVPDQIGFCFSSG